MANRLYNQQVSPKGYKRGGGVTGEKKPGKIRSAIGSLRKKFLPTFGEQFSKAKKKGKKTFTSTRDDKKKGKLEYSTKTAAEVKAAKKECLTEKELVLEIKVNSFLKKAQLLNLLEKWVRKLLHTKVKNLQHY